MNGKVVKWSLLAGVGLALGLVLFRSLPFAVAQEPPTSEPGILVTVAGTGTVGSSGDGGPATQAMLRVPGGLAVDRVGNLYIADLVDHRVRKVDTQGTITTFAGTGKAGYSGDNGPAREARLDTPNFLAFDGEGNLFIAQADLSSGFQGRVRKVSPDGIITPVAGGGHPADGVGDGGPATSASFQIPHGLAVDGEGNLYIPEEFSHRVRKVSKEGIITTVAGTGVRGSSGDGGPALQARLNVPTGAAVDRQGNLYIAEFGDCPFFGGSYGSRVRKVSPEGIITTVAGVGPAGYSGDGGPAIAAQLMYPIGVAVDSAGNLFIADLGNYRVRKVDANGIISTVAGIGPAQSFPASGVATATALRAPGQLAIDAAGNLYISNGFFTPVFRSFDRQPAEARIVKVFGVAAPGLIAGQPFP